MAKKSSNAVIKPDEEWRIEADMRTLLDAEKIRSDPGRMAKVKAFARKQLEATATVLADANEASSK